MGQAFSGPNAFNWLPFTPKAIAVVKANPEFLLVLLATLITVGLMIALMFYVSYETGKPYRQPKKVDDKKSGKK